MSRSSKPCHGICPTADRPGLTAHERIRSHIAHRTPVLNLELSSTARRRARLFFNHARTSRRWVRSSSAAPRNADLFVEPDEELARGVVAPLLRANHAQAVALASRGYETLQATIVMPENSATVKIAQQSADYDATSGSLPAGYRSAGIGNGPASSADNWRHSDPPLQRTPGSSPAKGTAAKELLEEIPDLDLILTPVGGGGTAEWLRSWPSQTGSPVDYRVVGTEPS